MPEVLETRVSHPDQHIVIDGRCFYIVSYDCPAVFDRDFPQRSKQEIAAIEVLAFDRFVSGGQLFDGSSQSNYDEFSRWRKGGYGQTEGFDVLSVTFFTLKPTLRIGFWSCPLNDEQPLSMILLEQIVGDEAGFTKAFTDRLREVVRGLAWFNYDDKPTPENVNSIRVRLDAYPLTHRRSKKKLMVYAQKLFPDAVIHNLEKVKAGGRLVDLEFTVTYEMPCQNECSTFENFVASLT